MTQTPHRFSKSTEVQNLAGQLNENFDIIDQHLDEINPHPSGRLVIDVSGSQDVQLTAEQARNTQLVFTGTLTKDVTVTLPATPRMWLMQNLTEGDYAIICKTGAQEGGVQIPKAVMPVYPRVTSVIANGAEILWADEGQFTPPSIRARHSTSQTLANNTWTILNLDTVLWDSRGDQHEVTDGEGWLICRQSGLYSIQASVRFAQNPSGQRAVQVRCVPVSSSAIAICESLIDAFNGTPIISLATTWALNAGDKIAIRCWQTSGGNLDVMSSGRISPELMMTRIGTP